MNALILLAWPLVALAALALVAWRFDRWSAVAIDTGPRIRKLETQSANAHERLATLSELARVLEARPATVPPELSARLEKLERLNQGVAPAARISEEQRKKFL